MLLHSVDHRWGACPHNSKSASPCKVKVKKKLNGLIIIGNKNKPYGGSTIQSNFDHRIAMSFLVMGTASKKRIKINESNCVKTSFPNFTTLMNNLGAKIS